MVFKGAYENLLGSEILLTETVSGALRSHFCKEFRLTVFLLLQGERRKPKISPLDVSSGRRIRFREVRITRKEDKTDILDLENQIPTDADNDVAQSQTRTNDADEIPETSTRGRGRGRGRGSGRPRGRPRSSGKGKGASTSQATT